MDKLFKDGDRAYLVDTLKSPYDSVWMEIPKEKVPKDILKALVPGGAGVYCKNYYLSNTAGETSGKYFKLYSDVPKIAIKGSEIIKKMDFARIDFVEGYKMLRQALGRELQFKLRRGFIDVNSDRMEYYLEVHVDFDDYIIKPHKLENYKYFNEMVKYIYKNTLAIIRFSFAIKSEDSEYVENFREKYRREYIKSNKMLSFEELDAFSSNAKIKGFMWGTNVMDY